MRSQLRCPPHRPLPEASPSTPPPSQSPPQSPLQSLPQSPQQNPQQAERICAPAHLRRTRLRPRRRRRLQQVRPTGGMRAVSTVAVRLKLRIQEREVVSRRRQRRLPREGEAHGATNRAAAAASKRRKAAHVRLARQRTVVLRVKQPHTQPQRHTKRTKHRAMLVRPRPSRPLRRDRRGTLIVHRVPSRAKLAIPCLTSGAEAAVRPETHMRLIMRAHVRQISAELQWR